MLCYVPTSTRSQNALGVEQFVVHRKYQHRDADLSDLEIFEKLQSAWTFQRKINNNNVRRIRFQQLRVSAVVLQLAAHDHVWLFVDEVCQLLMKQRMIFNEEDPKFS